MKAEKKPWGYRFSGSYYCADCYAHEEADAPFDLGGEPDFSLIGVGAAGCVRCGRYALSPPSPVPGKHSCSACGCFGEDSCTTPAKQDLSTVAVPKRAGRKML